MAPGDTETPSGRLANSWPPLVMHLVASRQAFQMRDEFLPVCNDICPNLACNARPQNLLGSSRADAEERLECLMIRPRPGEVAQLGDDLVQPPIPCGFIGHRTVNSIRMQISTN
jgi:hypothetical protein